LLVVRWGARLLSAGILLFWGWFLIAHLLSEEGLGPHAWRDYVVLTAVVVAPVGFALAWKWEVLGGLMALVAYAIMGVLNPLALGGPFILWPITAVMFLTSAWLSAARRNDQAPNLRG
jgi:hypothetical protein